MGEVRFMISEAAKQVQVEAHVLRYWEEELGLKIGRTEMGHRFYTEDDIQLFRCIQKLKNEGMLLRDLKPLIPELAATRKKISATKGEDGNSCASEKNSAENSAVPKASAIMPLAAEPADQSSGTKNTSAAEDIPVLEVSAERDASLRQKETEGSAQHSPAPNRTGLAPKAAPAAESAAAGSSVRAEKTVPDSKSVQAQKTVPDSKSVQAQKTAPDSKSMQAQKTAPGSKSVQAQKAVPGNKCVQTQKEVPANGNACAQAEKEEKTSNLTVAQAEVIPVTQLEQVRGLIGDVLTEVVSANNETLEKNISKKVTNDVLREMDFLFQAKERKEEEHYRKLDTLIRQQQANRREAAKDNPITRLRKILT